ncbi:MAG: NYN domain-containing protein, partial [Planctomycetes bacterium]|nr:NYN domain-containing protein [Planctomycetota bacterium]
MEHVCIFIDGSNFYHALKEANLPTNVDFGKLAKALV